MTLHVQPKENVHEKRFSAGKFTSHEFRKTTKWLAKSSTFVFPFVGRAKCEVREEFFG